MPSQAEIVRILDEIRILGRNVQKKGSDHEHINSLIAWYSRRLTGAAGSDAQQSEDENRVALSDPYNTRVFFSVQEL